MYWRLEIRNGVTYTFSNNNFCPYCTRLDRRHLIRRDLPDSLHTEMYFARLNRRHIRPLERWCLRGPGGPLISSLLPTPSCLLPLVSANSGDATRDEFQFFQFLFSRLMCNIKLTSNGFIYITKKGKRQINACLFQKCNCLF